MNNLEDNSIIRQYMSLYNLSKEDLYDLMYTKYMNVDDRFVCFDEFKDEIKRQLSKQPELTIVPDYDADGICSGLIAYYGLKLIGFENINLYCPVTHYGYGLNPMTIHHIMNKYPTTELILTTDNGINADEGVEIASRIYNVDVIITDHHEGRNELYPHKAKVVINPNRNDRDEIYPFKQISGSVVIWKLLQSFILEEKYEPHILKDLNSMIYLVGISTISDVMPAEKENRDYIRSALTTLNQREMLVNDTYDKDIKQLHYAFKVFIDELQNQKFIYNKILESDDIGYVIAPILNSSRRILDSSELPFEVFTLNKNAQYIDIKKRVDFLISLNVQRKEIIKEEKNRIQFDDSKSCIVYQKYSVTHGIAGLIANEIMKKTNKPVIALSYDYSGSARSVEGMSLQKALSYVDEQNPDIILNWGGHELAAGVNVNPLYIDQFEDYLCEYFDQINEVSISNKNKKNYIHIKEEDLISNELANELLEANNEFNALKPFSSQAPQPIFKLKLNLNQYQLLSLKDKHGKIKFSNDLELIYWNGFNELFDAQLDDKDAEVICRFQVNEFKGKKTAQFIVSDIKFS